MLLTRYVKRRLTNLLKILLQSKELQLHANTQVHDYNGIRRLGIYHSAPYENASSVKPELRKRVPPVFISGRFRSGSTLLWNLFRNLPGHVAYYEPFNERRWFDSKQRGKHTDNTHRGVSNYWSEYQGMDKLTHLYNEDWIRYRLYMAETSFDYSMKRFIDELVEGAKGKAVLQFNRMDFRLPWLRANYPGASIIHIYRNPRDQWCSVLRNPKEYPASASSNSGFIDHFYLQIWYRDLVRQFPFLANYEHRHRYYLFYLIWKLSYCFGVHYSDISLSLEELSKSPSKVMRGVLESLDLDVELVNYLDVSFVEPSEPRWQNYAQESWFIEIERECDDVVHEFLQGVAC
ncbi:sulfotransferase [Marinobacter segnicrescens]|uniref:sulfotransferase n=1 Tax=Marinobacter segnicrescens TaxID=430453 RepID=UPI003A9472B6